MTLKRVLDNGFVRLVDFMGSDLSVSRAARVSYNAEPRQEDEKLLRYLYKNKHTSPFEAVTFTFEIKAPIFVFRQWHRHRTWSFNEVSARYTELPEEFYIPHPSDIGEQSKHNKQMRQIGTAAQESADIKQTILIEQYVMQCEDAFKMYHHLLEEKWPRELARMVLPLSTYSRMFATVDLHNLLHFLRLRLHEHSQYEIRVYAEALLELIEPHTPIITKIFKEELQNNDNKSTST